MSLVEGGGETLNGWDVLRFWYGFDSGPLVTKVEPNQSCGTIHCPNAQELSLTDGPVCGG